MRYVFPRSGWQERTMCLELKIYSSYDTRVVVTFPSTILTSAEILQCERNFPLCIFPQDEKFPQNILNQVSGQQLI